MIVSRFVYCRLNKTHHRKPIISLDCPGQKKKFLGYSLKSLPWRHGHPHLTDVILLNSFVLHGLLNITHCPAVTGTPISGNGRLSRGGHFVSGDLRSFVYAPLGPPSLVLSMRVAVQKQSFLNLLRQNRCRATKVHYQATDI